LPFVFFEEKYFFKTNSKGFILISGKYMFLIIFLVKFELTVGGHQHKISESKGSFFLDDLLLETKIYKNTPTQFYVHYKNKMHEIEILRHIDKNIDIKINGKKASLHVKTDLDLMLEKMGMMSKKIPKIN